MTQNWEPGVQYNAGSKVEYHGALVLATLLLVDLADFEAVLRQALQHHPASPFARRLDTGQVRDPVGLAHRTLIRG